MISPTSTAGDAYDRLDELEKEAKYFKNLAGYSDYLKASMEIEDRINQRFKRNKKEIKKWLEERAPYIAYFNEILAQLKIIKEIIDKKLKEKSRFIEASTKEWMNEKSRKTEELIVVFTKAKDGVSKSLNDTRPELAIKPLVAISHRFGAILDKRDEKAKKGFLFGFSRKQRDTGTHEDRSHQLAFLNAIQDQIASSIHGKPPLNSHDAHLAVKGALWILKAQLQEPKQKGFFGSDLEREIDAQLKKLGVVDPKQSPDLKAILLCKVEMDKITEARKLEPAPFGNREGRDKRDIYWNKLNDMVERKFGIKKTLEGIPPLEDNRHLIKIIKQLDIYDVQILKDGGSVIIDMVISPEELNPFLSKSSDKYGLKVEEVPGSKSFVIRSENHSKLGALKEAISDKFFLPDPDKVVPGPRKGSSRPSF